MSGSMIAGIPNWPFEPGEGPFRVKGGSYRTHQAYVDEHVPGGFAEMLTRLDPALQRFYAQPFLASSWYDLAPLVAMAPVCGDALGISAAQYVDARTKALVAHDIRGVYGFFVKLVSAKAIATRLPRLISLYFDFIETTTRTVDEHRVVTGLHGLPGPLTPWLLTVAQIYLKRVLELAKTGEHRVDASQPHVEGEAHGVPLLGFELEVTLART